MVVTKDVMDAIRERRSIRKYQKKDVPDATVRRILEAAINAPSAGNMQPWFFYVVKDEKTRVELSRAAHQAFVAEAPVVIVVCTDVLRSASRYGERGIHLYCLQDTAAAVQNMLLAATAFGLATCWVGAFNEEAVAGILKVNRTERRPVAMVPVGDRKSVV